MLLDKIVTEPRPAAMIDPYFTKVVELANVTAPLEQPSDQDWLRVEAELGNGPAVHEIPVTLCRFLHDLYFGSFHTNWSEYVRGLVWAPGERFFSPRPGSHCH